MSRLVTPPAGSEITRGHLEAAEALVAAQLGLSTLEEETGVAEAGEITSSGLIMLSKPCTSIQALTVAGAPAMGMLKGLWAIDVGRMVTPMPWGGAYARIPYTVTYTAGWKADTLPSGIKQAILALAGVAAAVPVGIKAESIGPQSKTYADAAVIGPDVLALLKPHRRLVV